MLKNCVLTSKNEALKSQSPKDAGTEWLSEKSLMAFGHVVHSFSIQRTEVANARFKIKMMKLVDSIATVYWYLVLFQITFDSLPDFDSIFCSGQQTRIWLTQCWASASTISLKLNSMKIVSMASQKGIVFKQFHFYFLHPYLCAGVSVWLCSCGLVMDFHHLDSVHAKCQWSKRLDTKAPPGLKRW